MKLSKLGRKLLLLQRNELLSDQQANLRKRFGRFLFTNLFVNYYQKKNLELLAEKIFRSELQTLKKILPSKINSILDIGCGIGLIDIYLNEHYKNQVSFYLVDKNRIDYKIKYGFSSVYESYNNLFETKKILLNNGIDEKNIFLFDVEKNIKINRIIDFIISLKSMGYHYPFENYLNLFHQVSSSDTVYCFDISAEKYPNLKIIEKHFEKIEIIYEENSIHPLKRIVCKGLKVNS